MSRLTDMFDSRFIPQIIESPVDSIIRKIEGDTETYICNRLMELNIDKDILMNQTQEIKRLNGVIAEYEDAEEQGLLLRLPCPIGTTVYNTTWWDDVEEKVKVDGKTFFRMTHKHKISKSKFSYMDIKDFGKTVFLTKEEADQALKQMGE